MDKWIPVSEILPDWYKYVMAASTYFSEPLIIRRVETGGGKDKWKWDFARYVGLIDCTITHWMPLPEPPNGDK